ncbi:hypothetical protein F443_10408 [Phytophthora nicotianae P1569]|uniref:Crinkler effector protein N-terminal domain-containing protein n=1 Tax=Phytophthora nicotianae P1569 TaxID=1317065 RepID=V9F0E0_PHYNI|nr:hypothetical protein F443_10408 [Phytophthora nicotianae P1569]
MVKLVCVFVGLEESLFFVNIDANESVGYLKDAIKEKKPWTVTGVARKLHLFLAKKDSVWLDATGVSAVELDANGQLQGFEGDTMDPERHALWRGVSLGGWSDPCAGGGTEGLS